MESAYFIIYPGKNPPPQNGSRLKVRSTFLKSTDFTSSTFPIQTDFSQNQPAAITRNTGSPEHCAAIPPSLTTFGKLLLALLRTTENAQVDAAACNTNCSVGRMPPSPPDFS